MLNSAQLEILNDFGSQLRATISAHRQYAASKCLRDSRLERTVKNLTGVELNVPCASVIEVDGLVLILEQQLRLEAERGKTGHPLFEQNRRIIISQALNGLKELKNPR